MDQKIRTFSQVLRLFCSSMDYKLSDAYVLLQRKHVRISKTSFYDYAKGTQVPTFQKAKAIIRGLGIEVKDTAMIEDILEASKNNSMYLEAQGSKIYTLNGTYAIPWVQLFNDGCSSAEAMRRFEKRRDEVSNGSSDYIARLIRADIKDHLLPPLERKEKNDQ